METITLWFDREYIDVVHLYLFGGVKFLDLLIVLMCVDIATGVAKAVKQGRLRSRTAYFGYARKIGAFGIIILANVVDVILDLNGAVAVATVLFYISVEGLSILENYAEIGGEVPKSVKDKLQAMNKEDEHEKS